ncbi:hypothetical protein ED28_07880 [[Pantoea] beijingensis]|uniref:PapC N-terminal domain-containing protein n=2 Tax=[Pantoea] beijingensis TaxID=1324864 RepID=A0A443IE48_9GAMM|nr:hypothetical protein ED28_07880 [[Pantoea] beijingensis]
MALLMLGGMATCARADETLFDLDIIRARGFDPRIAAQFKDGARFPAGETRVLLTVNGRVYGKVTAQFDERGQLCVTDVFLHQAKLKAPARLRRETHDSGSCTTVNEVWPQGTITLQPGENSLSLVIPADAILDNTDYAAWEHGGSGGVLNYNGQYMTSRSPSGNFDFWLMQTEAGFNTDDWIVRSSQSWNQFSESGRFRHQSAWAQHTLYNAKSLLRIGRFTLTGSGLGVGRIQGVQMTPEAALYKNAGAAVVSGIADTPSVIEIRQQNILLYSTTVPSGPFNLKGFSLLNAHTDLHVTQTGTDGKSRQYTVPFAAYLTNGTTVTSGIAWGIGRWDQEGSNAHPFLASLSKGWQLLPRLGVQTDVLYSPHYRALGVSSNTSLPTGQALALASSLTSAPSHQGMLNTLSISQSLGDNVNLGVNASYQNMGYREFSESIMRADSGARNRAQYGPVLSGYHENLGSFSLSWTRSTQSDGSHNDYAQLGWSRQISKSYLSVTAGRNNSGLNNRREDSLYVSLQIPLAENTSVSNWMNYTGQNTRYGSRFNRRESADTNWNMSVEHSRNENSNAFSAAVNQVTPWSQLSSNISYDSEQHRSLAIQSSGAVVLHNSGLLLSPWRVADTFGVVRVGQQKNVRIETTAGRVRTNQKGYAVLPSLQGWGTSSLQLDTTSLGKTTDVNNAWESLSVARGSVSQVNFSVVSTRRVLLSVRDSLGNFLPARAGVYDSTGSFITVTSENGTLFIPDAHPGMQLEVELPTQDSCAITLTDLPERAADTPGLYETASAVCQPLS